jgi:hypothetical protein
MKFPLWRLLAAIAAIALLSPAGADPPPLGAHADFSSAIADSPSKLDYLDYLVFASLADSSRLPTLTAYRAPESVRAGRLLD